MVIAYDPASRLALTYHVAAPSPDADAMKARVRFLRSSLRARESDEPAVRELALAKAPAYRAELEDLLERLYR